MRGNRETPPLELGDNGHVKATTQGRGQGVRATPVITKVLPYFPITVPPSTAQLNVREGAGRKAD